MQEKITYLFLGICLGLQVAIIEFCRNILGIKEANSTEFDKETHFPIIALIKEWIDKDDKLIKRNLEYDLGGSMRLGEYQCIIKKNSLAEEIYSKNLIKERHRHRYEVNDKLTNQLIKNGIVISGRSKNGNLVEIIEYRHHPWFLCCQFHPEFKSKPKSSHPLFLHYISSILKKKYVDYD